MSGSQIVVGAPYWDGKSVDQGRAFVFDWNGKHWVRVARLTADAGLPESEARNEGHEGDHFGASVALEDDTVVVGAPEYDVGTTVDAGAAYVFYRLSDIDTEAGPTWTRSSGPGGAGKTRGSAAQRGGSLHGSTRPLRHG